jgi:hypothetical protein
VADPNLFSGHIAQALDRLLLQFKGQPNIEGIISAYATQIQELETAVFDLMAERYVLTAVGAQLDGIGKVVDETRRGRDDTDYRVAILGKIQRNKANSTIEDLLTLFGLILPGFGYTLVEGTVASFVLSIDEALGVNDPTPEELGAQLHAAKGGGIRAQMVASTSPADERFEFAAADAVVVDNDKGYADDTPITLGGRYVDAYGS